MPTARRAVLALLSLVAASTAAAAAATATAGPEPLANGPWPRTWTEGALTLSLYQPEVQRWDGQTLALRAAAQVRKGENQAYGLVHLVARTEADQARQVVRLVGVKVSRAEFPSASHKELHWQGLFGQHVATTWELPLEKLQADAAIAEAERARAAVPPRNDPPAFVFRTAPALLVLVDGEPSWRAVEGTSLERLANTRPLVLRDPATGRAWLRLLDGWMTAPALDRPWQVAGAERHPDLAAALAWAAAQPQIDLLEGRPPPDAPPPPDGQFPPPPPTLAGGAPEILVATAPIELIITEGEPRLEPIGGTTLAAWKNTASDVLVDAPGNQLYVLVAGRWFTADSAAGPWRWVEPAALPAGFRAIPPGAVRESVLAAIPGTTQAREAGIANQVPQTAAVKRGEARFTPSYDGEPRLAPIEGTALRYVLNAGTPVIQVAGDEWYAVQDGVWFTAPSPRGPWSAATYVPPAVYAIPASSPVHHVTYVRVYGATPELVYVGYTPGYLGTYVGPGGLVYYGTGYAYPGWVGPRWYWPPYVHRYGHGYGSGSGARFGWSSWGGWGLSAGWGWGPHRGHGYGRPYYPSAHSTGGAYRSWGAAVRPVMRAPPRPPPGYASPGYPSPRNAAPGYSRAPPGSARPPGAPQRAAPPATPMHQVAPAPGHRPAAAPAQSRPPAQRPQPGGGGGGGHRDRPDRPGR